MDGSAAWGLWAVRLRQHRRCSDEDVMVRRMVGALRNAAGVI